MCRSRPVGRWSITGAPELARDDRLRDAEHAGGAALGIAIGIAGSYTRWSRRLPWPAKRLALHPTGGGLAVVGDIGDESELQLWDIGGTPRSSVRLPRILGMTWTRDGRAIVAACLDARVRRLAAPTLALEWTGDWAGTGAVRAVACGRGPELVGSGWSRSIMRSSLQSTGTLRTWDGARASRELDRRGDDIGVLAATSDGDRVAGAREQGKLAIWSLVHRRREGGEIDHGGEIASVSISHDDRRVLAANTAGRWASWRIPIESRATAAVNGHHPSGVTGAKYWSNDRHVVTFGLDGTTRIWDATRAVELGTLFGHTGVVVGDVDPSGRQLATAGEDRLLHLWSIELEWLLGAAALADALEAIQLVPSRAWAPPVDQEPLAILDHALDIWRDVTRAARLCSGWPHQLRELADRVTAIARSVQSPVALARLHRVGLHL